MKAWKDISVVPIPSCMAHLPLDPRGYPIPYNVLQKPDGTHDFRVIDEAKWLRCVKEQLCGLTGLPLTPRFVFVSGPKSAYSGYYTDLAMLPEAAEYALRVCPFLAAPKYGYSAVQAIEGVPLVEIPDVSTKRPSLFVAITTDSYDRVWGRSDILKAGPRLAVQFWKDGDKYTPTLDDTRDSIAVHNLALEQRKGCRQ